jgi:hypothetical protein
MIAFGVEREEMIKVTVSPKTSRLKMANNEVCQEARVERQTEKMGRGKYKRQSFCLPGFVFRFSGSG